MAGELRVRSVRAEAFDVVAVEFEDAEGAPLPVGTPGAHLRLVLSGGVVRQYTLCNGPEDREVYRIAVKREPRSRGGSAAIHALRPGDLVRYDGPFNHFEVDWSRPHLILVAAGIGITPILSMARHASARGHSFELHYFVRSESHAAFLAMLRAEAGGRLSVHAGLDPEAVPVRLRRVLSAQALGSALYLCGPSPFMSAAKAIAGEFPSIAAVHSESFAAGPPAERPAVSELSPVGSSGASDTSEAGDAQGSVSPTFRVRLARSGGEYEVPPGCTILEVLEAAGLDVLCSCRGGVCGMCVTEVLEGEPDHRDDFLSDASKEQGQLMAICVSRSRRPLLVLDL